MINDYIPRSFTFNTSANFRWLPKVGLLRGITFRGEKGWVFELGWLFLKIDIYNLHAWNQLCDYVKRNH